MKVVQACASVGMLKLFQKIETHYIENHYMKQLKLSKQKHLQNSMTKYTRKYEHIRLHQITFSSGRAKSVSASQAFGKACADDTKF